jgi:hypothetical protein
MVEVVVIVVEEVVDVFLNETYSTLNPMMSIIILKMFKKTATLNADHLPVVWAKIYVVGYRMVRRLEKGYLAVF